MGTFITAQPAVSLSVPLQPVQRGAQGVAHRHFGRADLGGHNLGVGHAAALLSGSLPARPAVWCTMRSMCRWALRACL